jgi:hypothetical protein
MPAGDRYGPDALCPRCARWRCSVWGVAARRSCRSSRPPVRWGHQALTACAAAGRRTSDLDTCLFRQPITTQDYTGNWPNSNPGRHGSVIVVDLGVFRVAVILLSVASRVDLLPSQLAYARFEFGVVRRSVPDAVGMVLDEVRHLRQHTIRVVSTPACFRERASNSCRGGRLPRSDD